MRGRLAAVVNGEEAEHDVLVTLQAIEPPCVHQARHLAVHQLQLANVRGAPKHCCSRAAYPYVHHHIAVASGFAGIVTRVEVVFDALC